MSDGLPRRGPGRPKSVDRQGAIELAMKNYWREGVHSLSLNELCRRARLSKPALYREFGGEDGLMDAALAYYDLRIVQPVLDAVAMERPFGELVELLIAGMTTAEGASDGCLFTEMRLARGSFGEKTEQRVRAMEMRRRQVFEAWFSSALGRGEVARSVSPKLAGRYIDAQISNVLMQMGAGETPELVAEQARLAFLVLQPSRPLERP